MINLHKVFTVVGRLCLICQYLCIVYDIKLPCSYSEITQTDIAIAITQLPPDIFSLSVID